MARRESLAPDFIDKTLHIWHEKYQPWFPILHETSISRIRNPGDVQYDLLRQAIATVIVFDSQNSSPHEKHLANQSRNNVIQHASAHSALRNLQALLILSINYFTAGQMTQYWAVMATCRR